MHFAGLENSTFTISAVTSSKLTVVLLQAWRLSFVFFPQTEFINLYFCITCNETSEPSRRHLHTMRCCVLEMRERGAVEEEESGPVKVVSHLARKLYFDRRVLSNFRPTENGREGTVGGFILFTISKHGRMGKMGLCSGPLCVCVCRVSHQQ